MAANHAQLLMLLNQAAQSQTMGINPVPMAVNPIMGANANLLSMLSQMQSKSSKPSKFVKSGTKSFGKGNNTSSGNANIAGLLAALNGSSTGQEERGRCIWVTGLPESYQDATKLINVFGNFGNVRKVVFSEKKPDGALIELDDARGSVKAVVNMQGQKLDGQPIKVSFTNIDQAGMKNDDKSKDVRQAKENWRFNGNKDGKFRKICMARLRKLSNNVIVSNLPEGKSDQLKKFIIESGYTVKSIEGSQRPTDESKPKADYTMALVELASVEEAIDAVANLHNSWPKKFGTMKIDSKTPEDLSFPSLEQSKTKRNPKLKF